MTRFDRDTLEEFFERASRNFPVFDGVCLWGYFFTGYDRSRLEEAGQSLESQGYRFVAVWDKNPEDDDRELMWLHVERIERHSIDTLLARNEQLTEFAAKHRLRSYDGFDVGAA